MKQIFFYIYILISFNQSEFFYKNELGINHNIFNSFKLIKN